MEAVAQPRALEAAPQVTARPSLFSRFTDKVAHLARDTFYIIQLAFRYCCDTILFSSFVFSVFTATSLIGHAFDFFVPVTLLTRIASIFFAIVLMGMSYCTGSVSGTPIGDLTADQIQQAYFSFFISTMCWSILI